MKTATYAVVFAEVISILVMTPRTSFQTIAGALLGFIGCGFFGFAVFMMKDSWRAGIAKEDEREMVCGGIYQISRNPAFVGFDLVYIGLLLMFLTGAYACFPLLQLSCCICRSLRKKNSCRKYLEWHIANIKRKYAVI